MVPNTSPDVLVGAMADRPLAGAVGLRIGTIYVVNTPVPELFVYDSTLAWISPTTAAGNLPGVLFVDKSYTGNVEDGGIGTPFKTIMGAVNSASFVAGVTILVAPGTYAENVVWKDLDKTALISLGGRGSTFIAPAAGIPFTWILGAAAVVTSFSLRGFFLVPLAAATQAMVVDGTALNSAFGNGAGLSIQECSFSVQTAGTKVIDLTRLNIVSMRACSADHILSVFNVSDLMVEVCRLDGATLRYDATQPTPTGGRKRYVFRAGTDFGAGGSTDQRITVRGHPSIYCDRSVVIRGGIVDGVLTSTVTMAPILVVRGQVGELDDTNNPTVALTTPATQAGINQLIDFSGAVLLAACAFTGTAGGPSRQKFLCRGCSIPAPVTPQFTANAEADLDLRGTSYGGDGNLVVGGNGTIDRDQSYIGPVANAVVDTTANLAVPFPAGATYVVVPNATQPGNVVAILSRAVTNFHWQGNTGGGTVDFLVRRAA